MVKYMMILSLCISFISMSGCTYCLILGRKVKRNLKMLEEKRVIMERMMHQKDTQISVLQNQVMTYKQKAFGK